MLHIGYLNDDADKKPSIDLDLHDIDILEDAFIYLKKKTGVYIDPCGDTKIYPDHQRMVMDFLAASRDKRIIKFREFFKAASDMNEVLFACGD